jgi:hypothetical protein
MKKKTFKKLVALTIILFLTLPSLIIFLGRIFEFTPNEYTALSLPTTFILFFMLVGCGVCSEQLED